MIEKIKYILYKLGISSGSGSTRYVILTKNYAIKIARIDINYFPSFLNGLLANRTEYVFWKAYKHEKLCPVLFIFPLYLFLVMKKAETLSNKEWRNFKFKEFVNTEDFRIPAERKIDSFGKINGKIVAIDYGS